MQTFYEACKEALERPDCAENFKIRAIPRDMQGDCLSPVDCFDYEVEPLVKLDHHSGTLRYYGTLSSVTGRVYDSRTFFVAEGRYRRITMCRVISTQLRRALISQIKGKL